MNTAFLCLGSNLGHREINLNDAALMIERLCGTIKNSSSIYETDPWGSSSEFKYLNQVIELHTGLPPHALLKELLNIEKNLGRTRNSNQNSDRTIDIDILFYNHCILNTAGLQLPHPRLHLRKFVLMPLNEINQTFIHPVFKKSVFQLLVQCPDTLNLVLFKKKM